MPELIYGPPQPMWTPKTKAALQRAIDKVKALETRVRRHNTVSVDQNTRFEFKIDDAEPLVIVAFSWQEALQAFFRYLCDNGFTPEDKKIKAINEMAVMGRVTLCDAG